MTANDLNTIAIRHQLAQMHVAEITRDADGYALEDGHGQTLAYCGFDLSGEGDYEEWNRRQRFRALFIRHASNDIQTLLDEVKRLQTLLALEVTGQ